MATFLADLGLVLVGQIGGHQAAKPVETIK